MDVNLYAELAQKILKEKANYKPANPNVEIQTVFDTENNRYLMLHVGWRGESRVYGCVVHIEIKNGKIWIQQDGTEDGVANDFIAAGVPKQDIVIGWHYPPVRKYTEFAVG